MNEIMKSTLTSMEVAEMVGKQHKELLRDIRKYVEQLGKSKIALTEGEGKISPTDFFKESTYTTMQNKVMPCYLVTRKGGEFIAHKLTGQKGTEFTARYINRFHEMEQEISVMPPAQIPIGEVASYIKAMDRVFVRQQLAPHKIAEAFVMLSEQFGIHLPEGCVKVPAYEQMELSFNRGVA